MKKAIIILAFLPLFAYADIIATFSNGNIEDVVVVSVGADEVVYKQGKNEKTIASTEVEGVLYDDGQFVAPPKKNIVEESYDTTSEDAWNTNEGSSDESKLSKKREKKERTGGNSEVGKAFKEAGVAIKEAFTTMFDAMGKKKEKSSSAKSSSETDPSQNVPASEDGW